MSEGAEKEEESPLALEGVLMFFIFLRHWFHEGTSIYQVWSNMTLHDQHLPMFLWEEASMNTVYVKNISPHKTLRNMTSKEAFIEEEPEVQHFRIFGFLVYLHVPKEKMTKKDPLGIKGTFVGYNESSKAYHIYIPG
jgi:hypothetical protein